MRMGSDMDKIEQMSFKELVDYATAEILQELIRGNIKNGVYRMLDLAIQWHEQSQRERHVGE
jgi:hypothetical protein